MKQTTTKQLWLAGLVAMAAAGQALAADDFASRISLSYKAGFNIKADFSNLGGFPALTAPGPAAGGAVDRTYDDGFNRVDSTGNAGGVTTFWGYTSPAQFTGGTVVMSSSSSAATGATQDNENDPQHGFELAGQYEIGGGTRWRWGIEGGVGMTDIGIKDNLPFASAITTISDAFSDNGIVPPVAPYSGTSTGPGPLVGSTVISRVTITTPGGAATTGERRLDGVIVGFRLGPYVELPVWKRVSFQLGAGLAVAFVDNDFYVNETTTIAASGTQTAVATTSRSEVMVGGYLGGKINCRITDRWHAFVGAELQHLGVFEQDTAGRHATLDLRKPVYTTVGFGFSF